MIPDPNIRKRLSELGIYDSNKFEAYKKKLEDLDNLVKVAKNRIEKINENINTVREQRKLLQIPKDFEAIEMIDKKINDMSVKKCQLEKKIKEILEYLERECTDEKEV